MAFDAQPAIELRPGERLLHGQIVVFNSDLLNNFLADQRIEDAPADLTALTYAKLETLVSAFLNRSRRVRDPETMAFGSRVCAERASRAEYRSAFGKAA